MTRQPFSIATTLVLLDPDSAQQTSANTFINTSRALALNDKVDRGECLDDFDRGLLNEVFADANNLRPLVARHPNTRN